MALVSARDAAKLAGKDRSTILRAVEGGRMSAQKTDRGYLIDPAELERVFGTLHAPDANAHALPEDAYAHVGRAAALEREVELLREMQRQWEEERTFLRSMLERASEQVKVLTDQRKPEPRPGCGSGSFSAGSSLPCPAVGSAFRNINMRAVHWLSGSKFSSTKR